LARVTVFGLVAVLCACSANGQADSGETVVTIDPSRRYQTIAGWEATTNFHEDIGRLSPQDTEHLLRTAVEKAGITRLRLPIRNGVEGPRGIFDAYARGGSYEDWRKRRYLVSNDNANPQVINWAGFDFSFIDRNVEMAVLPMQRILAGRGERLVVNVSYVAFVKGQHNLHEDPEEYAEFALATMLHLRDKYGLEPDIWEVILEPDLAGRWSGRRIGETIVATSRRFAEHGIRVGFAAPSTTSMATASRYFDDMLEVEGALPHLKELSYHRYRGVSRKALAKLTERSARYHVPISMLELWFGRAGPDVLFEDLEAGAVAFQNRVLAGLFVDARKGNLTLNKDARYNGAVFRAVRPGAVRVGTTSSSAALKALAFQRPRRGFVAALRATSAGNVVIRGLPAGEYVVRTVTEAVETERVVAARGPSAHLRVAIGEPAVVVIEPR
jgi:hypothetical protein